MTVGIRRCNRVYNPKEEKFLANYKLTYVHCVIEIGK